MRTRLFLPTSLALLAGCASWQPSFDFPPVDASAPAEAAATQDTLYARDGTPVATTVQPKASNELPARDLAPSEGGRMYILELYQKAIDERDALAAEVRTMQGDLEKLRAVIAQRESESAAQAARIEQLAAERQRAIEENIELAARLTTAQIRRLQAEKLLLETRLSELDNAKPAAPATPPPAETPAPAETAPAAGHGRE
jgi:hypothetical protein